MHIISRVVFQKFFEAKACDMCMVDSRTGRLLLNSRYQVRLVRLTLEVYFRGICVLQLGLRTIRDIDNFHLIPVVL